MKRTLHDRVLGEGAWGDALKDAFQAPPEHGGLPPEKKKRPKGPKGRESLARLVLGVLPRAASETARVLTRPIRRVEDISLFDQVFAEDEEKLGFVGSVKKIASDAHEYANVFDRSHPWNRIARTISGALGGSDDAAPERRPAAPASGRVDILGAANKQHLDRSRDERKDRKEARREARRADKTRNLISPRQRSPVPPRPRNPVPPRPRQMPENPAPATPYKAAR